MTSTPIRDQQGDHLITSRNSALLVIDYQPSQAAGRSAGSSLACELQRDWGRTETVPQIVEIVLDERLLKE